MMEQLIEKIKGKVARFDKLYVGMIFGLSVPVVALMGTYFYTFTNYTFNQFFYFLIMLRVITKMFSLCIIPNLAVFFVFLWLDMNKAAKGVLTITFILTVLILGYQARVGLLW